MSDRAVLEAVELGKTYHDARREIVVLNDLALSVSAGEWLAIVGASGAGKSTLLNLLGGLDTPSAGDVSVAGESLSGMSENERSQWRNQRLGFVFQMHHLLPEFTALESVAMPARIGGAPKQEAEAKRCDGEVTKGCKKIINKGLFFMRGHVRLQKIKFRTTD